MLTSLARLESSQFLSVLCAYVAVGLDQVKEAWYKNRASRNQDWIHWPDWCVISLDKAEKHVTKAEKHVTIMCMFLLHTQCVLTGIEVIVAD